MSYRNMNTAIYGVELTVEETDKVLLEIFKSDQAHKGLPPHQVAAINEVLNSGEDIEVIYLEMQDIVGYELGRLIDGATQVQICPGAQYSYECGLWARDADGRCHDMQYEPGCGDHSFGVYCGGLGLGYEGDVSRILRSPVCKEALDLYPNIAAILAAAGIDKEPVMHILSQIY